MRLSEAIRRGAPVVLLAVLPAACSRTMATPSTASLSLGPSDRVSILFSHHAWLTDESKRRVAACLADGVREASPGADIVPDEEFFRTAFPDLDARSAPREGEYLALLIDHPSFVHRIAPLRLRYLISVAGETQHRTLVSAIGQGLAFAAWHEKTALSAAVIDTSGRRTAERIASSADGDGFAALIGIVPIVVPALSEATACADLAAQLRLLLMRQEDRRR